MNRYEADIVTFNGKSEVFLKRNPTGKLVLHQDMIKKHGKQCNRCLKWFDHINKVRINTRIPLDTHLCDDCLHEWDALINQWLHDREKSQDPTKGFSVYDILLQNCPHYFFSKNVTLSNRDRSWCNSTDSLCAIIDGGRCPLNYTIDPEKGTWENHGE